MIETQTNSIEKLRKMKTFKNIEIVGWTKKNLSAIIRIGFADYGDYRYGCLYAISQEGEIYRPIMHGAEFFTSENLPEAAKWVLTKEQVYNEKSQTIIDTINKEFSTQTGSLDAFIRITFEYRQLIEWSAVHNIEVPSEYNSSAYYTMKQAVELFKEKQKLQEELTKLKQTSSALRKELDTLKNKVFTKFFVGKLGKRASTRRNQENNFINLILN